MRNDRVTLAVPAAPALAATIRLAASSLASRDGFSYDQVEDLRIAVSEATSVLLGRSPGDPNDTGSLAVVDVAAGASGPPRLIAEFDVGNATIELTLRLANGVIPTPPEALSPRILSATTDEHRIDLRASDGPTDKFVKPRDARTT